MENLQSALIDIYDLNLYVNLAPKNWFGFSEKKHTIENFIDRFEKNCLSNGEMNYIQNINILVQDVKTIDNDEFIVKRIKINIRDLLKNENNVFTCVKLDKLSHKIVFPKQHSHQLLLIPPKSICMVDNFKILPIDNEGVIVQHDLYWNLVLLKSSVKCKFNDITSGTLYLFIKE